MEVMDKLTNATIPTKFRLDALVRFFAKQSLSPVIIYVGLVYASRVLLANMILVENKNYFDDNEEFTTVKVINKLDNTLILTNI